VSTPAPPATETKATWVLVTGLVIGAITLLFLMSFPLVTLLTGKRIECGDTWWITLIFGLALGLASAFLGGYATVTGNISLPFLGGQPLATAAAGGIVFVAIGAGVAYLVTSHGCIDPQLVRARFTDWDYVPQGNALSFRFEENRVQPRNFVPAAEAEKYYVYVGVRRKGADGPERGEYPILMGPFRIGNSSTISRHLKDEEVAKLGNGCVEFVAFAVRKTDEGSGDFAEPFEPRKYPNAFIFNRAGIASEESSDENVFDTLVFHDDRFGLERCFCGMQ
jgi:hypothetical protein